MHRLDIIISCGKNTDDNCACAGVCWYLVGREMGVCWNECCHLHNSSAGIVIVPVIGLCIVLIRKSVECCVDVVAVSETVNCECVRGMVLTSESIAVCMWC